MIEIILGIVFIVIMTLFCFASLMVSSNCARWEEEHYEDFFK